MINPSRGLRPAEAIPLPRGAVTDFSHGSCHEGSQNEPAPSCADCAAFLIASLQTDQFSIATLATALGLIEEARRQRTAANAIQDGSRTFNGVARDDSGASTGHPLAGNVSCTVICVG
jgi:hypothetical protein